MNNVSLYTHNYFSSWNNFFNNWNRREKEAALKVLLMALLVFGFVFFPVRALEGYYESSVPKVKPQKAVDPKELETFLNSLSVVKGQMCWNRVPLRCESPFKFGEDSSTVTSNPVQRWLEKGG